MHLLHPLATFQKARFLKGKQGVPVHSSMSSTDRISHYSHINASCKMKKFSIFLIERQFVIFAFYNISLLSITPKTKIQISTSTTFCISKIYLVPIFKKIGSKILIKTPEHMFHLQLIFYVFILQLPIKSGPMRVARPQSYWVRFLKFIFVLSNPQMVFLKS